ncbi:MAG: endo-1,4-beta-xylanase [Defluviitaleaceae bacterium]|nr:endo-1,4-beta-xylanase [Defluviitaleaceae bacterium]MCL2275266.1 endo-1,4-beta-xylanase [Defluviitaleaceae bacterium]
MKHRTATATIHLPAANTPVTVTQTRHAFLFGCAEFSTLPYVNGEMPSEEAQAAKKRLGHMADLFNQVTLPFYWGRYEPQEGKPDFTRTQKAAQWLADQGMLLKGHPLCWHTVCAPWLLEKTNDGILQTQLARITRDVKAFEGLINVWDVINEAVIMPIFDKYDNALTRICKERGRIKLIKDIFKTAREANPTATLLINDFDMSEAYDILVEGVLEAGVSIDAIGLQSHMHQGCWSKEKLHDVLERFSRFGLPLHFTEVSLVSGEIMPAEIVDLNDHQVDKWDSTPEGEARQAQEVSWFYETLYAHPLVEAITYWSFMDGLWLKAPSGLLNVQSDPKPAYNALHERIKGKWWTAPQQSVTDENGNITVTGTKGTYNANINGKDIQFELN